MPLKITVTTSNGKSIEKFLDTPNFNDGWSLMEHFITLVAKNFNATFDEVDEVTAIGKKNPIAVIKSYVKGL